MQKQTKEKENEEAIAKTESDSWKSEKPS